MCQHRWQYHTAYVGTSDLGFSAARASATTGRQSTGKKKCIRARLIERNDTSGYKLQASSFRPQASTSFKLQASSYRLQATGLSTDILHPQCVIKIIFSLHLNEPDGLTEKKVLKA
jgi:hypothetical protein